MRHMPQRYFGLTLYIWSKSSPNVRDATAHRLAEQNILCVQKIITALIAISGKIWRM